MGEGLWDPGCRALTRWFRGGSKSGCAIRGVSSLHHLGIDRFIVGFLAFVNVT
jgi:hypothetical protein